jgi:hypothetical protein
LKIEAPSVQIASRALASVITLLRHCEPPLGGVAISIRLDPLLREIASSPMAPGNDN